MKKRSVTSRKKREEGKEGRQRREIRIKITLSDKEKTKLKSLSDEAELPFAVYIRDMALNGKIEHRKIDEIQSIRDCTTELTRIGGLLNQIARALNNKEQIKQYGLDKRLKDIKEIYEKLMKINYE